MVKNVPHLEITKLLLVNCNIANNNYQEPCIHLFPIDRLVNY